MSLLHRTYSSPNLKGRHICRDWESQQKKYHYETEDDEFYVIGDRVYVDGFRPASVSYFGEVEFGKGDWVGVVLDEPTGNHDGRLHGRQYFQCAPLHGLFVRPLRVTRIPDSALGSSAASSRMSTPLPHLGRNRGSKSPAGSSVMGSYYYDEDYRQDRAPTVASLTKKLRAINDPSTRVQQQALSKLAARQLYASVDDYRSPTPLRCIPGILKRGGQRSQSTEPFDSSRFSNFRSNEDSALTRTNSSTAPSAASVLNFRPRRAKLDEYVSYANNNQPTTVDFSNEPAQVGDRVIFRSDRGEMVGTLRFLGETDFATGDWAGIELDKADGKNNGSVLGERYFKCADNHGLFVPAIRVRKHNERTTLRTKQPYEFNSMKYTIKSPPPSSSWNQDLRSRSVTPYYSDRTSPYTPEDSLSSYSPRGKTDSFAKLDQSRYASALSSSDQLFAKFFADTPLPANPNKKSMITKDDYTYGSQHENFSYKERPKFDEADIELQLRKSLRKPLSAPMRPINYDIQSNIQTAKPKSIKYTFSSSKYDGNPIVRRTVEYN